MAAKQLFQEIIEEYGGAVANKSIELLLTDPHLGEIPTFTEFIAKNWRDSFSPTMIKLGCQFVGGNPKETEDIAVSLSLMNLSFRLWDDIIDDTINRTLKPTFVGKYGKSIALIYGGTISAKAFTIANQAKLEPEKKRMINELIWNYWATMSKSEINDLNARNTTYSATDKFNKIKAETINIQTCLKIGAIIGNGSMSDITHLENYGLNLGIMLELLKDVKVSLNLTLELEKKIHQNQLPLLLLLAQEKSEIIKEEIDVLSKKESITSKEIGNLIEEVLQCKSWNKYIDYYTKASKKCRVALREDNKLTPILSKIVDYQSKTFSNIARAE